MPDPEQIPVDEQAQAAAQAETSVVADQMLAHENEPAATGGETGGSEAAPDAETTQEIGDLLTDSVVEDPSEPEDLPVPDTAIRDVDKAWDAAHDQEYAREGKMDFLSEPTKHEKRSFNGRRDGIIDGLYEDYLEGKNTVYEFNGEKMSSREIGELGLDRTYEKHFGYDREGYHEHTRLENAANKAKFELSEFEAKYKAKKEIPKLIEDSKGLLKTDVAGEWKECLEASADGIYRGRGSSDAVKLMKAHNEGKSVADLQKMLFDQGHSGASYRMTMAMIKHFYKSGDSLLEILDDNTDQAGEPEPKAA